MKFSEDIYSRRTVQCKVLPRARQRRGLNLLEELWAGCHRLMLWHREHVVKNRTRYGQNGAMHAEVIFDAVLCDTEHNVSVFEPKIFRPSGG